MAPNACAVALAKRIERMLPPGRDVARADKFATLGALRHDLKPYAVADRTRRYQMEMGGRFGCATSAPLPCKELTGRNFTESEPMRSIFKSTAKTRGQAAKLQHAAMQHFPEPCPGHPR